MRTCFFRGKNTIRFRFLSKSELVHIFRPPLVGSTRGHPRSSSEISSEIFIFSLCHPIVSAVEACIASIRSAHLACVLAHIPNRRRHAYGEQHDAPGADVRVAKSSGRGRRASVLAVHGRAGVAHRRSRHVPGDLVGNLSGKFRMGIGIGDTVAE